MILSVQDYLRNSVRLLSKKGLYLGLTNQALHGLMEAAPGVSFTEALNAYAKLFSVLEWKTDFQNTIDEALLTGIIASRLQMLSIRFECSEHLFTKSVLEPNAVWQNFVSLLFEYRSKIEIKIIMCLDRYTNYSNDFLDRLMKFRESIHVFNVSFEFEHRSWKNPNSLKIFRASRIGIIQRDTPSLSGFHFVLPNYNNKDQYLRLLGRNQNEWFSKESSLRYAYDYTKDELKSIVKEIEGSIPNYQQTCIIAAHTPPENALSNILELAHILSQN